MSQMYRSLTSLSTAKYIFELSLCIPGFYAFASLALSHRYFMILGNVSCGYFPIWLLLLDEVHKVTYNIYKSLLRLEIPNSFGFKLCFFEMELRPVAQEC